MATRIIEYGGQPRFGPYPIMPETAKVAEQSALTATGSSQQSAAVNVATGWVIVQSDEQIYVACGSSPTATTNSYRINAGGEQAFEVGPGWKVAIRT